MLRLEDAAIQMAQRYTPIPGSLALIKDYVIYPKPASGGLCRAALSNGIAGYDSRLPR